MIDVEKRNAIWTLFKQGRRKKEIARLLEVNPKTVRRVINEHTGDKKELLEEVEKASTAPDSKPTINSQLDITGIRKNKKRLDPELIENVFKQCQGWGRRTHEVLTEEHGIQIGYSTLTRMLHELKLRAIPKNKELCEEVVIKPGEEMQHDTSPYVLKIGDKNIHVQCAGLYYRFSKVRYIKFYQSFDKFAMKSFMHEAITYWKYSGKICVIDNTCLAVLRGTGSNAIFHADMNHFAKRFGFSWLAHRLNHPNRKAGKERNFWTVETNFIPGRTFKSMEDLNRQALEWATDRYFRRPDEKTKLIPAEVWETEKTYLQALPEFIEPPYREHERVMDKYGYIPMFANHYWVPGIKRESVKVIEYPGLIKIFRNREFLIEYRLESGDLKNKRVKPEGRQAPRIKERRQLTSADEEVKLRALGEGVEKYLNFILSREGAIRFRNVFIKGLYSLFLRVAPQIFLKSIERALEYKINNVETIERIAIQMMRTDTREWPEVASSGEFKARATYLEGRVSEEPDLVSYGKLMKSKKGVGNNGDS